MVVEIGTLSASVCVAHSSRRDCSKEKERIGAAVASFVRKSFLTPEEVARQWYAGDLLVSGRVAERPSSGARLR